MNLTLQNASGLLREAEMLLAAKKYTRAFAIGALALEEIGKGCFSRGCGRSWWSQCAQETLRQFWRQFTHHAAKTSFLLGYRWKEVLYVRRRKLPPGQEEARTPKPYSKRIKTSFTTWIRSESKASSS